MVIKSYDQLLVDSFDRIMGGKHFDSNYQPYTREFLEKMREYFQDREEYEKCQFIKSVIDLRFDHDLGFKTRLQ